MWWLHSTISLTKSSPCCKWDTMQHRHVWVFGQCLSRCSGKRLLKQKSLSPSWTEVLWEWLLSKVWKRDRRKDNMEQGWEFVCSREQLPFELWNVQSSLNYFILSLTKLFLDWFCTLACLWDTLIHLNFSKEFFLFKIFSKIHLTSLSGRNA